MSESDSTPQADVYAADQLRRPRLVVDNEARAQRCQIPSVEFHARLPDGLSKRTPGDPLAATHSRDIRAHALSRGAGDITEGLLQALQRNLSIERTCRAIGS